MQNITYKAAVIGPKDIVAGLRALGLDVLEARNGEEASSHLRTIKMQGRSESSIEKYAIVLILETLAREIPEAEFMRLSAGELPAVVVIPGIEGSSESGEKRIKELTERALGSSII